jgi:DNA gyrase/topoisomerase IV subunit B
VNGIYVKNGGSHVDLIMGRIIESLREHVKKKHKIDVAPNQIRQHILFASWITGFPALSFDSQSKERITNSYASVSAHLKDIDFDKISKQILNTPEIVDPIIQSILYKKERDEALALAKKQKSAAKVRIVNHIAATDPNPENRMLLLCEGVSALSPLISVRNPKAVGGYAMKGKPLNVRGLSPMRIMENKEMSDILSIIGISIGKPVGELNYGKICVFSDFDHDGSHVFGLLLNLFSLWPALFEQGRVYRLMAPLFFCKKGKQTKSFYTDAEFAKFDSTGYVVSRFKGLGSMPEEIYSDVVNNPKLIQVTCDDLNKLEMAFGDSAEVRKTWMLN